MSTTLTSMPAIEIASPGGPEQLILVSRPVPSPGEGEVLIQVLAAGVNRPDVMQRQGKYAPPPGASDIPGLECCGRDCRAGPKRRRPCRAGPSHRVTGGRRLRGVRRRCCVIMLTDTRWLFRWWRRRPYPKMCSPSGATCSNAVPVSPGDVVLVHGGTSGIGTIAIQLASTLGARVFATAGSADKARACERLGAVRGIDYKTEDFVQVILQQTNGVGADVILDMVGGSYVPRNMAVAAPFARIVSIAASGGSRVEVDIAVMMQKRLTLTGSTLRSRPLSQKAALAESVRHSVWPLLSAKRVRPVLHATFPLAQAAAAHRLMESSSHVGKIMLTF